MSNNRPLYVDAMRRGGITRRFNRNSRILEIPPVDPFGGYESEAPAYQTGRHAIPPPAVTKPRSIRGDGLVVLMLLSWIAVTAVCSFVARGCR